MKYRFPADMYISTIGSYVIGCYILNQCTNLATVHQRWKKAIRSRKEFDIDNLQEIADYFRVPYTLKPIAMVVGKFNTVFLPYINGQLFPIREDGIVTQTMATGKIYPLEEPKTNIEE